MQALLRKTRAEKLTRRAEIYAALYRPTVCPINRAPYWINGDSITDNTGNPALTNSLRRETEALAALPQSVTCAGERSLPASRPPSR